MMLKFSPMSKIFLYGGSIDLRNGFEGLSFAARQAFGDILVDAYYVFLNRRRTRAKVLHWNGKNLSLWYTHSQKGVFSRRHLKQACISPEEFQAILNACPPKHLLCPETAF